MFITAKIAFIFTSLSAVQISYIDLAKPKSGALVSLFDFIIIKTVIKLLSTGCRRVLQGDQGTSPGREEVARSGTWERRSHKDNIGRARIS